MDGIQLSNSQGHLVHKCTRSKLIKKHYLDDTIADT